SIESRGHYWLINTASLIDYPQQARALRIVRTAGGGVAIQTWMLDHTGSELAAISRQLAYLDAQGGRPKGFAGGRLDRNVTLYVPKGTLGARPAPGVAQRAPGGPKPTLGATGSSSMGFGRASRGRPPGMDARRN